MRKIRTLPHLLFYKVGEAQANPLENLLRTPLYHESLPFACPAAQNRRAVKASFPPWRPGRLRRRQWKRGFARNALLRANPVAHALNQSRDKQTALENEHSPPRTRLRAPACAVSALTGKV